MTPTVQMPPCHLRLFILIGLCLGLSAKALATSVTIELPDGAAFALDVRSLESGAGATSQSYVAFSGVRYVLQQFNSRTQWDWDARMGLLRLAVGEQRFSFPSGRAVVAVNDKLVQVALPIRFVEGEIWMPLGSLRLVVRSLEGLKVTEPIARLAVGGAATSASIVQSPEQALRGGLLSDGSKPGLRDSGTSASTLAIPPPDVSPVWKVVLAPALIEATDAAPSDASAIRPALRQIAERCATILTEEGSMQPFLLTEHDDATTPDMILEWLSRRSPDLIVFLRVEASSLRAAPGYTILYTDESVDWLGVEEPSGSTTSTAIVRRDQGYLPFQVGSRQLAEKIGSSMAEVSGFRDKLILPAPLYLLKRCPARSVMIALAFPEQSPDLTRLADSGFRETVARALAGALIAFRREHVAPAGERLSGEALRP
jgi:hypothetical protein